jgi:hypothetical protein
VAGRGGKRGSGRAGGGRGAAAAAVEGTSVSAAASAAALAASSSCSSSSCSAPSVPAALSACCSLASSRKAAKMSVGTRSRWPRSWRRERESFFFRVRVFFERKKSKFLPLPFSSRSLDALSLFSLSLSLFLCLTCLNSTPSLW